MRAILLNASSRYHEAMLRPLQTRSQLLVLWLALLIAGSLPALAAADDRTAPADGAAEMMVTRTVAQAIQVLGDHRMLPEERRQKLIEVVAGRFDFSDMARSSLDYHWRQLTPAQQQQFVQLFTAFIEEAYLNKLEDYSGQKIKMLGQTSLGPGQAQVDTLVVQPNEEGPIHLDYRLKQYGDEWKVYDVAVDNISITANYRNQFNHVINSHGFDVLMQDMQAKRQELLASLGK